MRKNLILDIDNTLIYGRRADQLPTITDTENNFCFITLTEIFLITKRPNLNKFLLEISEHFNIYSYTSASKNYADYILDRLEQDINKKIFIKRFYNTDCKFDIINNKCDMYKNISNLGFNIKNTIVIDDKPDIYREQFYNIIFIEPLYLEDSSIFFKILELLETLKDQEDVRYNIKLYNEKNYPEKYNDNYIQKIFYFNPNYLNDQLK